MSASLVLQSTLHVGQMVSLTLQPLAKCFFNASLLRNDFPEKISHHIYIS